MTATQADTQSYEKENIHNYNVRGSKQKSGAANIVGFIKQLTFEDEDETDWRVVITKNRDGPNFSFFARFHRTTGIVKEIEAPDERTKRIRTLNDDNVHTNEKPRPVRKAVTKTPVTDVPPVLHSNEVDGLVEPTLPDTDLTEGGNDKNEQPRQAL